MIKAYKVHGDGMRGANLASLRIPEMPFFLGVSRVYSVVHSPPIVQTFPEMFGYGAKCVPCAWLRGRGQRRWRAARRTLAAKGSQEITLL